MATYGSGGAPDKDGNNEVFRPNAKLGNKTIVGGVISGKTLYDEKRNYYLLINEPDGIDNDDGRVWIYRKDTNKIVGWYDSPSGKFNRGSGADADEERYFSDPAARKDTYGHARTVVENALKRNAKNANITEPGANELSARTTAILNGTQIPQQTLDEARVKDLAASGEVGESVDINPAQIEGVGMAYSGEYFYPLDIQSTKQDRIKFSVIEKIARPIKQITANQIGGVGLPQFSNSLGSVTLPIQPVIQDNNRVEWAGMSLNAIESQIAGASYGLAQAGGVQEMLKMAGSTITEGFKLLTNSANNEIREGLRTYLAQEAAGVQGLLSRTSGAVLNPNMELLFKGPQLRPFSFSFKMSPREQGEAIAVRNIIRFFKQNMSVRTTKTNVFLKEPYVFKIEYQTDENNPHPSINKIKECALLDCSVNYTPDGTYMTFNDEERTMTSYSISLQFQEIEPIYNVDYNKDEVPMSHIGF